MKRIEKFETVSRLPTELGSRATWYIERPNSSKRLGGSTVDSGVDDTRELTQESLEATNERLRLPSRL